MFAQELQEVKWRLVYPTREALDEPPHPVSIRDVPRGAQFLQAIAWPSGKILRAVRLDGHPVWLPCRGFGLEQSQITCVVFGWGRPDDDGVQVHVEAIYRGRWMPDPPKEFLDTGAMQAIFTQTCFPKGGAPWQLPMSYTSLTPELPRPSAWWESSPASPLPEPPR